MASSHGEWPEPIVRVQALSETVSGGVSIPDRYIKPPSERPTACDPNATKESHANVPVIDLGSLSGPGGEERMRRILDACCEWGFFQVVNHGVTPELLRKTRQVWREFFHQPREKKEVYANSPDTYEGYGSRLGVEKGANLDWGDYYFIHVLPESARSYDKWPALPTVCREVVEEYSTELEKVGQTLMKVLSANLGLEERYLERAFGGEEMEASLRVCFYPKCPRPEMTLGLSRHSDPGGLTLLLPDDRVNGLQVLKDGCWLTVQSPPDSFVVNIGDQIQVVSNGMYKSVEHRVTVNATEERLSLAFFYNPKGDLPLGPFPHLLSPDKPPLYQNMTFNAYRAYIRKWGLVEKRSSSASRIR